MRERGDISGLDCSDQLRVPDTPWLEDPVALAIWASKASAVLKREERRFSYANVERAMTLPSGANTSGVYVFSRQTRRIIRCWLEIRHAVTMMVTSMLLQGFGVTRRKGRGHMLPLPKREEFTLGGGAMRAAASLPSAGHPASEADCIQGEGHYQNSTKSRLRSAPPSDFRFKDGGGRVRHLILRAFAYGAAVTASSAASPAPLPPSYSLQVAPGHESTPLDAGSPAFEPDGTVCLRDSNEVSITHPDGHNEQVNFDTAVRQAINRDLFSGGTWDGSWDRSRIVDTSIVIDKGGRAYTIVVPRYSNLKTAALLWSTDDCHNWHALALTARNATIERPDEFNDQSSPPTILSYENYGSQTGNHLWLDLFQTVNGEIQRANGAGTLVADDSLLVSNHSGGGNSTYTTSQAVFVVYPTTDHSAPGTQAMGRQWDRRTNKWSGAAGQVGRSTTQVTPDVHDIPVITMKADGKAVVVIGAHHALFKMLTSNASNNIIAGWGKPEIIGAPEMGKDYLSYSYASLNMTHQGTINIIARAEGDKWLFNLVQFRKTANGNWSSWPGYLPHRVIATPDRPAYGLWYQHVTEDRTGRLYLNFAYSANQLTNQEASSLGMAGAPKFDCRNDRCFYVGVPYIDPRTLVSDDDGVTWH